MGNNKNLGLGGEGKRSILKEVKCDPALRPAITFFRVLLLAGKCKLLSPLRGFGNVSTISDIKQIQAHQEKV